MALPCLMYVLLFVLAFVESVSGFVFKTGNDVKISYNLNFNKKCHSENGRIAVLFGMSIAQCVRECGLRDHCGALNFWRLSHLCELFSSPEEGVEYHRGCIQVTGSDIEVGEKPCGTCGFGQMCDTGTRNCVFKECQPPSTPDNGRIIGNANNIGATVRFECDDGYTEKNGVSASVCQDSGQWSVTFECVVACGPLPSLDNGHFVFSTVDDKTRASVICNIGYRSSVQTIHCTASGIWQTTACDLIVCGALPSIVNGNAVLDNIDGNSYLATATVTCDLWYQTRTNVITCTDTGDWETAACADCYMEETQDYAGYKNTTLDGLLCVRWDQMSPHQYHDFDYLPDSSATEAASYCRNPNALPYDPWCYTSYDHDWGYCGVEKCV